MQPGEQPFEESTVDILKMIAVGQDALSKGVMLHVVEGYLHKTPCTYNHQAIRDAYRAAAKGAISEDSRRFKDVMNVLTAGESSLG